MWIAMVAMMACAKSAMPTATISVGGQDVKVEIAANGEDRATGLMNRDSLPANEGMLFMYPQSKELSFWMRDTRIPLSIAFITQTGSIVKIADMQPYDLRSVRSGAPAVYALEMNQGWFETNGIDVGDKVTNLPDVSPK